MWAFQAFPLSNGILNKWAFSKHGPSDFFSDSFARGLRKFPFSNLSSSTFSHGLSSPSFRIISSTPQNCLYCTQQNIFDGCRTLSEAMPLKPAVAHFLSKCPLCAQLSELSEYLKLESGVKQELLEFSSSTQMIFRACIFPRAPVKTVVPINSPPVLN